MLSTHRSVTVPVASRNPMNGNIGVKEVRKGMESRKIGKKWTNRKGCGGFGDSWSVCLFVGLSSKVPKLTHYWVVLFHPRA